VWLSWLGSMLRCRKQHLSHPENGVSTFFCKVATFIYHAVQKPRGRPLSSERPHVKPWKQTCYGIKLMADIWKTAFPTIQRALLCNVPSPRDAINVYPTKPLFILSLLCVVVLLPRCSRERIQ